MRRVRCSFLVATLLALSFNSNAQLGIKELPLTVAYYGDNGLHPGLRLGTSYAFHTKEKTKIRKFKGLESKWGSKRKVIDFSADLNLGFYNHPNNHLGTLIGVGVSRIRTKLRKNRVFGFSLEINYLRKFYNIPTYNESGRIRFAGSNNLMISLAPTFGKNILLNKDFGGIRIFVKPGVQIVRYNHTFLPNAALELGGTINFKK